MGKQIVRQPRIIRMEKGATGLRITWSDMKVIEFSQNVSIESVEFSDKILWLKDLFRTIKHAFFVQETRMLT